MFNTTINHHLRAVATAGLLTLCIAFAGCSDLNTREDFSKLVEGKTEQEVRKSAGKPDSVDETDKALHVWTYKSRTIDIENKNKLDGKTVVTFAPRSDGRMVVASVKYD